MNNYPIYILKKKDNVSHMILELTATINSEVEEILSFRCCSIHGLNFELLIKNNGTTPVEIQNYFLLRSEEKSLKCDHLYPPNSRSVAPGEHIAFYTSMDNRLWDQYTEICIYDGKGHEYCFKKNGGINKL